MNKFKLWLAATLLTVSSSVLHADVRINSQTRTWEGNICANNYGWTYVNWQPIGALCQFRLPNGMVVSGIIINR